MSYLQWLQNAMQPTNVFSSIFWWIITSILGLCLLGIAGRISGLFSAFIVAKQILKDNRQRMTGGLGTHLADRFIDIWVNSELQTGRGQLYERRIGTNSQYTMETMDRLLVEKGLIHVENNKSLAVKNFRNSLVFKLIRRYLVWFCDEDMRQYILWEKKAQ